MTSSDPSPLRNKTSLLIPLFIWAIFLSGLLLQVVAPHLRVEHDSFVIPADVMARGSPVDPQELVRRERTIQTYSALLAVTGAVGLAIYYRRNLFRNLPGRDV